MGTLCNELNSPFRQSVSSSVIPFTPGAGHSFPCRAGEREGWCRTSTGTGWDQRHKGKGRHGESKEKPLFCTSSASAKAFRCSTSQGRTRASASPGHSHLPRSEGSGADPGFTLTAGEPRAEHKLLDSARRAEFQKPTAAVLVGGCLC